MKKAAQHGRLTKTKRDYAENVSDEEEMHDSVIEDDSVGVDDDDSEAGEDSSEDKTEESAQKVSRVCILGKVQRSNLIFEIYRKGK
jgi:hypothetical protein